jgi:hypothetical protein
MAKMAVSIRILQYRNILERKIKLQKFRDFMR